MIRSWPAAFDREHVSLSGENAQYLYWVLRRALRETLAIVWQGMVHGKADDYGDNADSRTGWAEAGCF